MSVTMYHRAKVKYENTIHNLTLAKSDTILDDAAFDMACFDAQQSIEFLLKAVLLENNVIFDKKGGHDILYLLNLIKEKTDFTFSRQDELRLIAATITSWEEKGRYSTGIKTKENTVRKVLNIFNEIDKEFINNKEKNNKESDIDKV